MDTTQILKIQMELAQRAFTQPTVRHKRLYRFVADAGWLQAGLEAVFANRGSGTPGLDKVTKGMIDAQSGGRMKLIQQLREELMNGTYRPLPVKRVYIPKANGKLRPLGIPMVCAYCISFKPVWGFERKVGMGEAYGFDSDLGSRRIQVVAGGLASLGTRLWSLCPGWPGSPPLGQFQGQLLQPFRGDFG